MKPETLLMIVLNSALGIVSEPSIRTMTAAILAGNATDEQLAEFTRIVHNEFDEYAGCMVEVITELHSVDVPCYAINHAIRTYVRACDKREAEAAEKPEHRSLTLLDSQPGKCSNTMCWCWK